MANCKHCGAPITWKQSANGKWIPGNTDGSDHRCMKRNNPVSAPAAAPRQMTNKDGSKPCKFCGKDILWKNLDGRWIPHNPDNSKHMCNRGVQ